MGARVLGVLVNWDWFDNLSILLCLAGVCLLLGGWPALRWSWPAIAFLIFMMPLPSKLDSALALELRKTATVTSTYTLQTLGLPAVREGTMIYVNDSQIDIAPACSGLGILLTFVTLSTAIVLLTEKPWPDKLVILASAFPIAIIANIVRITMTALLYELNLGDKVNHFFHDAAGWLMMLVALVILGIELKILGFLFVPVAAQRVAFDFTQAGVVPHRSPRTA
jgi:exosortase